LTFIIAVRAPLAAGVKLTEIVQWDFAARLPPQGFVGVAKSLGLAPVNVMLLIVNAVERFSQRHVLGDAHGSDLLRNKRQGGR